MYFNVDRIAVLAGLGGTGSSGLMREGVAPAKPAPGGAPVSASKAPAPPAPSAPKASAPPAPPAKAAKPMEEDEYDMDEMYMDDEGMDEMYHDEDMDEMYHDHGSDMKQTETVYEVDEVQLMEALVDMRERRLEEGRVRSTVRKELTNVLNEMEAGSRWIYGNRKPTNSGKGKVAKGFLGPGFR